MRKLLEFLVGKRHWFLFMVLLAFSLTLIYRNNAYQRNVLFSSANVVAGRLSAISGEVISYMHLREINKELLERNGLTAADVDLFVPHQANMRIIEAVGSRLKIGLDHVFTNVAEYGNTSSASVPLALVEAMAQGRIKAGDRVLVTAFGSGLTWGAALLQF